MKEIPNDVQWVIMIQNLGQPIGKKLHDRAQEIIEENPDYFKWEHRYNTIPKEVHDSFRKECYPNLYEFKESVDCGKGILDLIREKSLLQEKDTKSLKSYSENLKEKEEKVKKEELRIKNIWKKHYSKYNLSYR